MNISDTQNHGKIIEKKCVPHSNINILSYLLEFFFFFLIKGAKPVGTVEASCVPLPDPISLPFQR